MSVHSNTMSGDTAWWLICEDWLHDDGSRTRSWEDPAAFERISARDRIPRQLFDNITRLTNLRFLDVSCCGLTTLPSELALAPALDSVFADANLLTEVPTCVRDMRLMHISFIRNLISEAPAWLNELRSKHGTITRVMLNENPLRAIHACCLFTVDYTISIVIQEHIDAYKDIITVDRSEMYPETRAALEYLEYVHL